MAGDLIPLSKPSSAVLSDATTAWPDLGPSARALLLGEILAFNPDLFVTGGVDYESSLEPVLKDEDGNFFALSGKRLPTLGGPVFGISESTRNLLLGASFVGLLGYFILTIAKR